MKTATFFSIYYYHPVLYHGILSLQSLCGRLLVTFCCSKAAKFALISWHIIGHGSRLAFFWVVPLFYDLQCFSDWHQWIRNRVSHNLNSHKCLFVTLPYWQTRNYVQEFSIPAHFTSEQFCSVFVYWGLCPDWRQRWVRNELDGHSDKEVVTTVSWCEM